jgi:hypothetical protein
MQGMKPKMQHSSNGHEEFHLEYTVVYSGESPDVSEE